MINKDKYDKIKHDLHNYEKRLVNDTMERFKKQKLMKKKSFRMIKGRKPANSKMLFTTKNTSKGNPGRSVISTAICPTSNLAMYVGCHLQTIAKEIQSHVKDAKDFLQKLNQTEETAEDGLIVTLDVKPLHSKQRRNKSSPGSL